MFERPYLQILTNRINEERKFIQVLMGPRQVGKTTLVTQLIRKLSIPHLFVSADAVPASDNSWLSAQWGRYRHYRILQGVEDYQRLKASLKPADFLYLPYPISVVLNKY